MLLFSNTTRWKKERVYRAEGLETNYSECHKVPGDTEVLHAIDERGVPKFQRSLGIELTLLVISPP